MDEDKLFEQIQLIRSLYASINTATAGICKNFTVSKINDVLEYREKLLKEISEEEYSYKTNRAGHTLSEKFLEIHKEIKELIKSILQLDNTITGFIRHEKDCINQELSGLYKTSRAAMAYALQRR